MRRLLMLFVSGLPAIGFAQLNGDFQFQFTNNPSLWDFSGVYGESNAIVEFQNTFAHAPSGAVTGQGKVVFEDGVTRFHAAHTSKGRVSGSAARRISLAADATGQFDGTALGRPVSGPFKGIISLTLDPASRSIVGTESATLCARGFGCRTVSSNVNFTLPPNMDGTWSLVLNLTTSNALVRGSAAVQLSNERVIHFNVRGRRQAKTAITRLTLVGTGDAFGVRIPLRVADDGGVQSLGGKLFGQRLQIP
jgi:hypothetical protein